MKRSAEMALKRLTKSKKKKKESWLKKKINKDPIL